MRTDDFCPAVGHEAKGVIGELHARPYVLGVNISFFVYYVQIIFFD